MTHVHFASAAFLDSGVDDAGTRPSAGFDFFFSTTTSSSVLSLALFAAVWLGDDVADEVKSEVVSGFLSDLGFFLFAAAAASVVERSTSVALT